MDRNVEARIRFPIELGARYTIVGRPEIEGTGWTVNISSDGALITSTPEGLPGTLIGVVIEWPILLADVCPVALHIPWKGCAIGPRPRCRAILDSRIACATKTIRSVQGLPKWRVRSR